MKKLIYTDNIGFDMSDWINQPIRKVFAGTDCIMAVTEDGRTMQKIISPDCAAAVRYWTRIEDISLSATAPGLAIGLVSDGTCLIAKKPARILTDCCAGHKNISFTNVNETIKSWNHIVQVAVSDTFFAVTDEGKVCYAALSQYCSDDYREVLSWKNIKRISVGLSNSIIGITKDGRMLCAGANLRKGPNGDITKLLDSYSDVTDVCMSGSECESIVIAHRDGTVENLDGLRIPVSTGDGKERILWSHFGYCYYIMDTERNLYMVSHCDIAPVFPDNPVIDSFAVGDTGYSEPFVIAVAEDW